MSKKYTNSEIDFLIKNYQKLTIQEIADSLNRTYGSVFRKAQDLKLTKTGCLNNKWSESEIQFLKNNYKNKTNKELSNILNRSQKAIEKKLNTLKLKRDIKYYYNKNKFNSINNEYDAYWLGFLFADGYVCKSNNSYWVGLELQYSDINHLKKFNKFMESNREIEIRYSKSPSSNNVSKMCKITYFSKEIFYNLEKCGCITKKTKKIHMPYGIVPDNLMKHFIRGYFDGDGSCGIYKHSQRKHLKYPQAKITSGSVNFVNELKDYLISLDIYCGITNNNTVYDMFFSGKDNVIKFLKYLYDDCNIYLDRKYEIYKRCLDI